MIVHHNQKTCPPNYRSQTYFKNYKIILGDVSKYVFTFDGNSPNDIKKSLRNNKLCNGTQLLIKHF